MHRDDPEDEGNNLQPVFNAGIGRESVKDPFENRLIKSP